MQAEASLHPELPVSSADATAASQAILTAAEQLVADGRFHICEQGIFFNFAHLGIALNALAIKPGPIGQYISRRKGKLRQWAADTLPPPNFLVGSCGKHHGLLVHVNAWQKHTGRTLPSQVLACISTCNLYCIQEKLLANIVID